MGGFHGGTIFLLAASVAAFAWLCYGVWRLYGKRRLLQPRPESAVVAQHFPPSGFVPNPIPATPAEATAAIKPPRPALPYEKPSVPTGPPAIAPDREASAEHDAGTRAEKDAEYTAAFADISARAPGADEPPSMRMWRIYRIPAQDAVRLGFVEKHDRQKESGRWHLIVEDHWLPRHDLRSSGTAAELLESAPRQSAGTPFVDATVRWFETELGNDLFSETFGGIGAEPDRWITRDPVDLGALATGLNDVGHLLHGVVGVPFGAGAAALGANNAMARMADGIGGNLILAPVDRQLGQAARKIELIGIVVAVAFGVHPLALACTKLFLHAELNQAIGDVIKEALFDQGAEVVRQSKAVEPERAADQVQVQHGIPTRLGVESARDRRLLEGARQLSERRGFLESLIAEKNLEVEMLDPAISEPDAISEPGIDDFEIGPAFLSPA